VATSREDVGRADRRRLAQACLMAPTTRMITADGTDRAGHMPMSVGFIGRRMLPIDFGGLQTLAQTFDPPRPVPNSQHVLAGGSSVSV
jgi:hypothetical protein